MKGFTLAIVVAVSLACGVAEAGPFARRRAGGSVSTGQPGGSVDTSSAQGVASYMARVLTLGHWGGNRGREGTGMGSTPEAALRSCCYHPQNPKWRGQAMNIRDQGVAQGRNGMFYACIRE